MTRRVCLLTGASGRLGSAFLARHAKDYRVVAVHHLGHVNFASQDQSFVDPLEPSRPIPSNEHAVHAIRADLSRPEDVDRVVSEASERWGAVDVVVHAAGVHLQQPILSTAAVAAAEVAYRVNVLAPLRIAVALAQGAWRRDPDGNARANRNVIHVSSTSARFVYEECGDGVHAATYAALDALTYHLASELWDLGVRVNGLALGRAPDDDEISAAVDALAALDASSETGRVLTVRHDRPGFRGVASAGAGEPA